VDYYSATSPSRQKPVSLQVLNQRFKDSRTILILTIRDGVIASVREQFTP
jgi:hypothetical protein